MQENVSLLKKETLPQVFSCEFCEISKSTFSYRIPIAAASAFNGCKLWHSSNIFFWKKIFLFHHNFFEKKMK